MRIARAFFGLLVLAVALAATVSCSSTGSDVVSPKGATGQLQVSIHDQMAPSFQQVWVTFSALSAHAVGGQWIPLAGTFPQTVDLLTLVGGRTITLGADSLPVGTYDELRVTIAAVRLVLADGTEVNVTLPQGGQMHEVHVATPFEVRAGETVAVSLDFRPGTSFSYMGMGMGWSCNPDIVVSGVMYPH